jgi:predicted nucleic acid-binding protein
MIHLDTSALIASLTGPRSHATILRRFIVDGERLGASTLVLYEWWRGPRTVPELRDQEALVPAAATIALGSAEAALAADLYRRLERPRRREIDIAIAACAIAQNAALWTLNPQDFAGIPGLQLAGDVSTGD